MSLADPFGFFALGAGRNRTGGDQHSLLEALRQVWAIRTLRAERGNKASALADLGWQAAYHSLWDETPESVPDHVSLPSKDGEVHFF